MPLWTRLETLVCENKNEWETQDSFPEVAERASVKYTVVLKRERVNLEQITEALSSRWRRKVGVRNRYRRL